MSSQSPLKPLTDEQYHNLKLRASLCPSLETEWDPPEYQHWRDLHASGTELRATVGLTQSSIEAVEKDNDLSIDGKKRKRQDLAKQALAELEQPKSLQKARESCASVLRMWQQKVDAVLAKPKPDDAATALLYREIRDKFATLKDQPARLQYLDRYGADPQIASALLLGPAGLTSLSDAERALLRAKVEEHVDPKIIQARHKVTNALSELERGYRAGRAMVTTAGRLDKEMPMPKKVA